MQIWVALEANNCDTDIWISDPLIEALCEKFGIAIDWTSSNVFPYIEELAGRFIKFEIATSIFWICLIPIVTLIVFFVAKYLHKKAAADDVDWDFDFSGWPWAAVISWIIFGGLAIASVAVVGVQAHDIIECLTIPEKAIIDYFIHNNIK